MIEMSPPISSKNWTYPATVRFAGFFFVRRRKNNNMLRCAMTVDAVWITIDTLSKKSRSWEKGHWPALRKLCGFFYAGSVRIE